MDIVVAVLSKLGGGYGWLNACLTGLPSRRVGAGEVTFKTENPAIELLVVTERGAAKHAGNRRIGGSGRLRKIPIRFSPSRAGKATNIEASPIIRDWSRRAIKQGTSRNPLRRIELIAKPRVEAHPFNIFAVFDIDAHIAEPRRADHLSGNPHAILPIGAYPAAAQGAGSVPQ